tara:strand:- start:5075 stop:5449 length:375 start_codon:yes stop_codon:yes gene_type:complete
MTIERIDIPKYVKNREKLKEYIQWLDWSLKIEEYVYVKVRKYPKEQIWGWCEPNENTGNLDVCINTMHVKDDDDFLETIAHEYVHVDQHDKDRFVNHNGTYKDDPNEIEAWKMQKQLVEDYKRS